MKLSDEFTQFDGATYAGARKKRSNQCSSRISGICGKDRRFRKQHSISTTKSDNGRIEVYHEGDFKYAQNVKNFQKRIYRERACYSCSKKAERKTRILL